MIRLLTRMLFGCAILLAITPTLLYRWGLSNLDSLPKPSIETLSQKHQKRIWAEVKEVGEPRVKPVNPYVYLLALHCQINNGLYSSDCLNKYPGLRLSALAVRDQVSEQVNGRGNTVWQFTWIAATIWVTQNWTIQEILATYHQEYDRPNQ